MERNGNYIAVGVFVLVVLVLGFFWLIWLTGDDRHYDRYSMYFEGSVLGLSEGSEVTYMGVDVGRVADINIDPNYSGMVQVLVDIEEKTPIRPNTYASLAMRGVTGLVIIELSEDPESVHKGFRKDSLGNREISVKPSLISKFAKELPQLSGQVSALLQRFNDLMSEDNIANISQTLANIEAFSSNVTRDSAHLGDLITDARKALADMSDAADSVQALTDNMGPRTDEMMASVDAAATRADEAMRGLNRILDNNNDGVQRFVNNGLPELTELIIDARTALNDISELAQTLKEDPSQLIYQTQPRGMEIQR
ncbi:MAG: MlaD family protein [Ketobacteraceae bacterium]|nr:MlaD family protein [Ketobacteraceae bacterium]